MQCTAVNVLSPLASYSVPATAVELPQGVGSDAAQARHTSFQAAENGHYRKPNAGSVMSQLFKQCKRRARLLMLLHPKVQKCLDTGAKCNCERP